MKKFIWFFLGCFWALSSYAQVGKVGINTTNPSAMLHVKDSSVLFNGIHPLPGSPGNPPAFGAGTRMMWYPDKAAFRAGTVSGTQWNKDSIGLYSIALGRDSKAKGNSSVALGISTSASGVNSTTMGQATKATQHASTAMGFGTLASAMSSTSMGQTTVASGNISTAMGESTTASGQSSTAMGKGTVASGNYSTAIGESTLASGSFSVAMGIQSIATNFSSTAMGNNTIASGNDAISMGSLTKSSGLASTAMGRQTTASGNYATSLGFNTTAKPYASVVMGQFNDTSSLSTTDWNLLDPVFMIGNGANAAARSNAVTVLKNGNTGIGTIAPQQLLHVSKGPSGAITSSNAVGVFENDDDVVINLITPNANASAIFFGNPSNAFHGGIGYNAVVSNGLDFRTNGNSTKAVINNVGNMGIGDNSPNARLHVKTNAGGGLYHSDSDLIVEDSEDAFIHLSTPNTKEGAILAGNNVTSIRSGMVFRSDSSVHIRTGGNTTRLTIDKSGNTITSGEIRRTSTGPANMVPICYGAVGASGTILSGSGNFSVTLTPPGNYEIAITNETYTNAGFTVSATAVSSNPRFVSTGNTGTNLVVRTFTSAGVLIDNPFHFVIYKE